MADYKTEVKRATDKALDHLATTGHGEDWGEHLKAIYWEILRRILSRHLDVMG